MKYLQASIDIRRKNCAQIYLPEHICSFCVESFCTVFQFCNPPEGDADHAVDDNADDGGVDDDGGDDSDDDDDSDDTDDDMTVMTLMMTTITDVAFFGVGCCALLLALRCTHLHLNLNF